MKPEAYQIATLIGKYLRQTISEQELSALQAWLDEKEENRQLLESFRKTYDRQRDIDFLAGMDTDAAWNRFKQRKKRKPFGKIIRVTGYAAAVVVVLFLGGRLFFPDRFSDERVVPDLTNRYHNDVLPGENKALLLLSDGRRIDLAQSPDSLNEQDGTIIAGNEGEVQYVPNAVGSESVIYNTLVVPKAGTYRIVLSDGSKVWINALSELRFPVRFAEDERKVMVKGEAFFEVVHDADRPFRVEVNGMEVEVLGTQFNVNAYTDGVTTTLIEGAVKVSAGQQEFRLSPGEQSYVDGGYIRVQQADVAKAIAWQQGEFYFKSDKLTDVMDELARWYDLKVDYKGDIPTKVSYTGRISRNVNLTEVLEMLRYLSKADFEVRGRQVRVSFTG